MDLQILNFLTPELCDKLEKELYKLVRCQCCSALLNLFSGT